VTDDRSTLPVRPELRHRRDDQEYQPRHLRREPEGHGVPPSAVSPEGPQPPASGTSTPPFPRPYDRPGLDTGVFPPPPDTGELK